MYVFGNFLFLGIHEEKFENRFDYRVAYVIILVRTKGKGLER